MVAFDNKVFQDTYIKGYKDGYKMGVALKTENKELILKLLDLKPNKNKSTNPNAEQDTNQLQNQKTALSPKSNLKSSSMQRGIDGQIDLLEQMKDFLSNLSEQFEEMMKTQEGFIRGLDSEGLDLKLLETFESYLEENKNKIKGLIDSIENEELPYTERIIRHLEDTPR